MDKILTVFAACLLFSLPVFAGQPLIQYDGPLTDGDFQIVFQPVNGSRQPVNQDIHFTVKANQPFYLQLFARADNGILLPILQQDEQNPRSYQAGREFVIPDSRSHFQVPCPGRQQVVMVASPAPLPLDEAKSAARGLATRGAYLEPEKAARVVSRVELEISGIVRLNAILQTGRDRYGVDEYVPLTITAPADGWVNLWVIDPDSSEHFITRRAVTGKQKLPLTFKAFPPTGRHTIVALFEQSAAVNHAYSPLSDAGYGKCPGMDGFSELTIEIEKNHDNREASRSIDRIQGKEQKPDADNIPVRVEQHSNPGTVWQDLRNMVENAAHPLTLSLNQRRYRLGENLVVLCQVQQSGYLSIISLVRKEQEATLLFPNRFQQDNRIKTAGTIQIPARGAPFTLPARPPEGEVMLIALLTDQPLNLRGNNIQSVNQLFAALQTSTLRSLTLVDGLAGLKAAGMVLTEVY